LVVFLKQADNEVGQWLKWIFGLPLLNAEEISGNFIEDFKSVFPDVARLKKSVIIYVIIRYIDETSKCNPKIWALSSMFSERNSQKHIQIYFCFYMY